MINDGGGGFFRQPIDDSSGENVRNITKKEITYERGKVKLA